jgi:hypothetical protein
MTQSRSGTTEHTYITSGGTLAPLAPPPVPPPLISFPEPAILWKEREALG